MSPIDALARVAEQHHGLFTLDVARARGIDSKQLTRMLRRGVIRREGRGVYRFAGSPGGWPRDVCRGVFAAGPGALAAARTALALWVPELERPRRPQVQVARGRRPTVPGCDVRGVTDLHLAKPAVVQGVPVTGLPRALLDSAHDLGVDRLQLAIDAAQRARPVADGALVAVLHEHERQGRAGVAVFRRALAERALVAAAPDSDFERYVLRDLARAGLEAPVHHHVVWVDGGPHELDLAWPHRMLDVELDGGDHLRKQQAEADKRRDRSLQRIGWRVLRYSWDDYVRAQAEMLGEIAWFLGA